ncbi:MAG: hypothetical protein M3318_00960 [Actinomycetota bacterium]|nr:hypothetical protein [Actinomycetota bacterium]
MDKAKSTIKKAAGKLPGIETEEAQEGRAAREEGSSTGHQEYFRDLIEETNRRSESGGLGGHAKEDRGSGAAGSREPLQEATREYVERLKEAYPGINERDLYELVYPIALRRVEDAEGT